MADLVFGFGTSHSSLLVTEPEQWDLHGNRDRRNKSLTFNDKDYTYDELLKLRQSEYFVSQNDPAVRKEMHDRNQKQLDALAEQILEVDPDVLVVIGDDQAEWFGKEIQPAFSVFCGDKVTNKAASPERFEAMDESHKLSFSMFVPPEDQDYPVASGLAEAIIEQAIEDEFDVTASMVPPVGPSGSGIGHAVGFIYRRILRDKAIPLVPVLINTYFPPNQAKPGRCYDFGRSIGRAISGWESGKRVAVCASGGLSHYVLDEEWDQKILAAMCDQDVDTIRNESNDLYQSGSSEMKNWIATAGAVADSGLQMTVLDYVPSYRTEAGTGCANGFATWT